MDLTIIEIMKSEVCHNHKNNCDICPILTWCENGKLEKLIKDMKSNEEYTINVE